MYANETQPHHNRILTTSTLHCRLFATIITPVSTSVGLATIYSRHKAFFNKVSVILKRRLRQSHVRAISTSPPPHRKWKATHDYFQNETHAARSMASRSCPHRHRRSHCFFEQPLRQS